MKNIRLDKFLADMQIGTRSEVKQYLKKGRVTVNDEIIKKPETKIDPATDRVCFDNREIVYESEFYYMLNKPEGVISASRDKKAYTVIKLLPSEEQRPDLFPVGRLDKDTTGLLLISNNGALSHNMLSPSHHVDKTYLVHLESAAGPETQKAFSEGIDIGDADVTLPAKMVTLPERLPSDSDDKIDWLHESLKRIETVLKETDSSVCSPSTYCLVTIHEGRFHQIKRMFHACGQEVIRLRRLTMGPLKLDDSLREGESRRLSKEELELLAPYMPK